MFFPSWILEGVVCGHLICRNIHWPNPLWALSIIRYIPVLLADIDHSALCRQQNHLVLCRSGCLKNGQYGWTSGNSSQFWRHLKVNRRTLLISWAVCFHKALVRFLEEPDVLLVPASALSSQLTSSHQFDVAGAPGRPVQRAETGQRAGAGASGDGHTHGAAEKLGKRGAARGARSVVKVIKFYLLHLNASYLPYCFFCFLFIDLESLDEANKSGETSKALSAQAADQGRKVRPVAVLAADAENAADAVQVGRDHAELISVLSPRCFDQWVSTAWPTFTRRLQSCGLCFAMNSTVQNEGTDPLLTRLFCSSCKSFPRQSMTKRNGYGTSGSQSLKNDGEWAPRPSNHGPFLSILLYLYFVM